MDRCDIVITAYRLNAVLPPAKALQRVLGLNEADAAALAKRFPCVVRSNEEAGEAERLCHALQEAGAYAELQPHEELRIAPAAKPPAPAPVAKATAQATSEPAPGYVLGDLQIARDEPKPQARVSAPQPSEPAVESRPPAVAAKPGEAAVSGNVQMLDDGFGGDGPQGPALELDLKGEMKRSASASSSEVSVGPGAFEDEDEHAANLELDYDGGRGSKPEAKKEAKAPSKVSGKGAATGGAGQAKKTPDAPAPAAGAKYAVHGAEAEAPRRGQINIREKSRRPLGLLGTVFYPLVFVFSLAPAFWIAGGIAGASGFAVYQLVGPGSEDGSTRAQPPHGRLRKRKVDAATAAVEAPPATSAPTQGSTKRAAEKPKAGNEPAKGAEKMAWSEATERRSRMHGIHKVTVDWPAQAKLEAHTECMLVDTKYTNKLDALESTGTKIVAPPKVEEQLAAEAKALKASKRYQDRDFIALCLSN